MASNVNNQVGDVSLKMGVDTTSVAAEAAAGAEAATKAAQAVYVANAPTKADPALSGIQQTLSAQLALEQQRNIAAQDAIAAANAKAAAMAEIEDRTRKVMDEANAAAAEMEQLARSMDRAGTAGNGAFGTNSKTTEGLKGMNKALSDSVGQAQALFGKLAIVAGTATGMFALGQAIREYVVKSLESGAEKAKDFAASLNFNDSTKSAESLRAQIQQVEGDLAATKQSYDELRQAGFGATADLMRGPEVQKKLEEELAALRRSLRVEERDASAKKAKADEEAAKKKADADDERANQQAQKYIDQLNARIDASAEYNARVDKSLEDEATARERQIQDFKESMKEMGDEMTKQARRAQEAWVDSLRSIREESNRAFNTDQAASMVQLAGNLRTTATIATANMNRIVVGGDD